MDVKTIFVCYLSIMNLWGFFIMGLDKHRAKVHAWRISESSLFLAAILGGSLGSIAGMFLFRHKTKHWYFVVGMPLICVFHLGLVTYMFYRIFG